MSLGLAVAAAVKLEVLCKLIIHYQRGSSHPHRSATTTPALDFLKCVLGTSNVGFWLWKRQGKECVPYSEQKTLRFVVAISSWVVPLLNLCLASTAALPHAHVNIALITDSSAILQECSYQCLTLGLLRGGGTC